MRSLLALTVSSLLLAGCVTENSYEGSNRPVVENKINNVGAARTRIALALQYLETGNNSQAKYNLERALNFAPNLPEVHYSFAYYYQQVGENSLADKAYQKAISVDPNDPNTRNNYGTFLCSINEYERATDQFLKAIEIPSYIRVAESYENLALCAIEFDDFDNAQSYFQSALNHSSQRATTIINLAALYYAKSDLHKAEMLLERYESTGKISSRSLLLKYLVELRMGHIEKAETTSATILQTYPTSTEAALLREQTIKRSEFELLRAQYRQAQLDDLQEQGTDIQMKADPKIRIIRKKSAPSAEQATQSKKSSNTLDDTTQVVTPPTTKTAQAAKVIEKKSVDTHAIIAALTTDTPATDTKNAAVKKTLPAASANQQTVAPPSAQPKTRPTTTPASSKNDEVKIVSFGNRSSTLTDKTEKKSTGNKSMSTPGEVVFYQPDKDPSIFNQTQATTSQAKVDFSANTVNNTQAKQAPLLNPALPAIEIPFHILGAGENLFSISVQYNVRLQKLLRWNNLKESDRLNPGTKIFLNDPDIFYEINEGDTLYSIATLRHLLIDELMRWNKLTPDVSLKPGYKLLLVDPDSYVL